MRTDSNDYYYNHLYNPAAVIDDDGNVMEQTCIAISIYVLVAIIKKELKIELRLSEILQVPGILLFEKVSITQVLTKTMSQNEKPDKIFYFF